MLSSSIISSRELPSWTLSIVPLQIVKTKLLTKHFTQLVFYQLEHYQIPFSKQPGSTLFEVPDNCSIAIITTQLTYKASLSWVCPFEGSPETPTTL